MTNSATRPIRLIAFVAGVLLLAASVRSDNAEAGGPPSLAVTFAGVIAGDVIDTPVGPEVRIVDPAVLDLYNNARTDAIAWATASYGNPVTPICPLDEGDDTTLGLTGGLQTGGLDTPGGQLEYLERLDILCPTYPPPSTQEARAAAACFQWLLFIPGHVEANPAIGIVNFETWAWMEGVLADGYINAVNEEPAPVVRNVALLSSGGGIYNPNNAQLHLLPGIAGAQGLYGRVWLTGRSASKDGTWYSCSGADGGNVIDHAGSAGRSPRTAAAKLLGLHPYSTTLEVRSDLVSRNINTVEGEVAIVSRYIDPRGVTVHAEVNWSTYYWDFEGDLVDEYRLTFWDNGSGNSFTSAGATQATIDNYSPNAISHTYTQAGRYDLQARIGFNLISRGGWAYINETYEWTEYWPAQRSTPSSLYAWQSPNTPDISACPPRDGSTCSVSGAKVYVSEPCGYMICGAYERDPDTNRYVRPLVCLWEYEPTCNVWYGDYDWTWNYGPRLTCDGELAADGPAQWSYTDVNTVAGAPTSQPHRCLRDHYVTVKARSPTQTVFKYVSTQPAFTLYGDFYKSLDRSRSDLDFREHFGSTYLSTMGDGEVVRYPVRRFWPYLVD